MDSPTFARHPLNDRVGIPIFIQLFAVDVLLKPLIKGVEFGVPDELDASHRSGSVLRGEHGV